MPATKRGIYHNLRESKYTVSNTEIVFYFSSESYLNKFMDGYQNHREKFADKWNKTIKEKTPLNVDTFADIIYYIETEKRGFFVRAGRAMINKNDLFEYALRKMMQKPSPLWVRK
ncbi:transcriptional regulator [Cytobacillus phage Bfsp1]|nr:transcriptional regulator [Cytobacillus phage Bfsp1]